jgi:transcriptional regulator with XRE-family HTH domain
VATKNLPIAVRNLRKIWDTKKDKFEVTQVQAAKKLGWTQGAFSQYLNNLTELHADAVAKLANFLEVDPHEIDPNYNPVEAERFRVPVTWVHGGTLRISEEAQYRRRVIGSVFDEQYQAVCGVRLEKDLPPIGYAGQLILCYDLIKCPKPKLRTGSRTPQWLIIKKKKSNCLEVVEWGDKTPKNQLDTKLLPIVSYLIN